MNRFSNSPVQSGLVTGLKVKTTFQRNQLLFEWLPRRALARDVEVRNIFRVSLFAADDCLVRRFISQKANEMTTLEYTIYLIGKENNLPRLSRRFADPENIMMGFLMINTISLLSDDED